MRGESGGGREGGLDGATVLLQLDYVTPAIHKTLIALFQSRLLLLELTLRDPSHSRGEA